MLGVIALAVREPPGLVDVDDDVVDVRMLGTATHDVGDDLLRLAERPVVDRVVHAMEGPGRVDVGGEVRGQRHQGHTCGVGDVGNQLRLTARVGQQHRAKATRAARRSEHFQLLEPIAVVVHANRAVGAAERIERLVGTNDRARVRHRVARRDFGTTDLQNHDGLAGIGGALQRRTKRCGTANCLKEQADRARALVLDVKCQPVRCVTTGLRPDRDNTPKADAWAEGEHRLPDRAGSDDGSDAAVAEARTDRAHPRGGAFRDGDPHAIDPDADGVGGDQALTHGGTGDVALFPRRLGPESGNREHAVPSGNGLVERRHDRAGAQGNRHDVGRKRHVGDARHAAMPRSLLALRVHADNLAAVGAEVLQQRVAGPAIRRTDDRRAANVE